MIELSQALISLGYWTCDYGKAMIELQEARYHIETVAYYWHCLHQGLDSRQTLVVKTASLHFLEE